MNTLDYSSFAALEIGTTYSGYAFSFKPASNRDSLKICINPLWKCEKKSSSEKRTSTCILFDMHENYITFGYEAEEKFAKLWTDGTSNKYFFFRRFHSLLYDGKNVTNETELKDVNGKVLLAKTVFKTFIGALYGKCMEEMKNQKGDAKIGKTRWVITIPSELTDKPKEFMQCCAIEAGIPRDQLMLLTEAEAAFTFYENNLILNPNSTEFMIVDLQGCLTEIRVVKKLKGLLIERYHRRHTDCESASPYTQFYTLLNDIVRFETSKLHPLTYLEIERGLETAQCSSPDEKSILVPRNYIQQSMDCKPDGSGLCFRLWYSDKYRSKIHMHGANMIFDHSDMYSNIFKQKVSIVLSQIDTVFNVYEEAHKVQHVVMTGDFYDCRLVERMINQNYNVLKLHEEAVMKGAVLYGHQPYQYMHEPFRAYSKLSTAKGVLLLINIKFIDASPNHVRKGSSEDVQRLKEYFSKLNYDIETRSDINRKGLIKSFLEVREHYLKTHAKDYHTFVCIIMSHGGTNGISTKEGGRITMDEIVKPFRNNKAQRFIGKPKIFMVQACRGRAVQEKHRINRQVLTDYQDQERLPTDADIIKIYATIPGYVSFRENSDRYIGSWFMRAFLVIAEQYPKKHLLEMLTFINNELATNALYQDGPNRCQMSMFESTLTKLFYLN